MPKNLVLRTIEMWLNFPAISLLPAASNGFERPKGCGIIGAMSPLRHRRSALKDSVVRVLFVADGELGAARLRMMVEQESKSVPDATWYGALNRLADEGLISEMGGRNFTAAAVQAVIDNLTDLMNPLNKSERGIISLTRSGRLYALALRLASLAKPSARWLAERDLDLALAAVSATHGVKKRIRRPCGSYKMRNNALGVDVLSPRKDVFPAGKRRRGELI